MTEASGSADLITLDQAIARFSRWPPVGKVEREPLSACGSRMLAADVIAPVAVPPFDNAAMDGYAFRHADLTLGRRMTVTGRSTAGGAQCPIVEPGEAARIFTGAPMPEGTDTVAAQEHCRPDGDGVELPIDIRAGANCRKAGEDVKPGDVVLAAGRRLRAQDLAIAAAVGRAELPVRRRVRVAVLATGSELRSPGGSLPAGGIYESNRPAVTAALRQLGADATDLGIVVDTVDVVRDMLAAAAVEHDLILSTGGVSVGEEDHVREAVTQLGTIDFWRVAIRPGKPVAVGEIAQTPFIGLPGNPAAALVTFWVLARELVLRLQGELSPAGSAGYPATALFHQQRKPGRRDFLRVVARIGADGKLYAERVLPAGAGILSSLVNSDGLLEVPETHGDVHPGDVLRFRPYVNFT